MFANTGDLAWLLAALGLVRCTAADAEGPGDTDTANIFTLYVDSGLPGNASMSWSTLEAAFKEPKNSDVASYDGVDWTKPFPGSSLSGFAAHVRLVDDVHDVRLVDGEPVNNSIHANVVALSNGIPPALMDPNGQPKPMDESWYICRHWFVGTLPDPSQDGTHDCSAIPATCRDNLRQQLVEGWGSMTAEPGFENVMCTDPRQAMRALNSSCAIGLESLGTFYQWFNQSTLANATKAKSLTVDEVSQQSFLLGTTFSGNNETAYDYLANLTIIVVEVSGHSVKVTDPGPVKAIASEVICLSGKGKESDLTPNSTTSAGGSPTSTSPSSSKTGSATTTAATPSTSTSAASGWAASPYGNMAASIAVVLFLAAQVLAFL